nr:ribonuclease H-like domain-containing protein [Tanacetum cinerariifolium]
KPVLKVRYLTTLYVLKPDLYWTRLPEFADDTVTDYSRPAPTVEGSLDDAQNRNPSVTTTEASPSTITPKPFIKFIKATDSGSQIKFEDINQINEDDMEEMNIKWNMALLSMRADRYLKKTGKKITIQGTDVAGFDKSKQYGNFKAEGSETLKQTFNRLQVIVSQLQFMDVEIEQDDLNQKFLTSLAPEWLMHTIVWRNRSDLDTMSLDDLYNHLKVYEFEVQKKSEPNSQNMAFITSAKHNSGNEEVNIASGSTAGR